MNTILFKPKTERGGDIRHTAVRTSSAAQKGWSGGSGWRERREGNGGVGCSVGWGCSSVPCANGQNNSEPVWTSGKALGC